MRHLSTPSTYITDIVIFSIFYTSFFTPKHFIQTNVTWKYACDYKTVFLPRRPSHLEYEETIILVLADNILSNDEQMFYVTKLSDTLAIEPQNFDLDYIEHLKFLIQSKYVDTVSHFCQMINHQ